MRPAVFVLLLLIAGCSSPSAPIEARERLSIEQTRHAVALAHEYVNVVHATAAITVTSHGKTTNFDADCWLEPGGTVRITPLNKSPETFGVSGPVGGWTVDVTPGPDEKTWRVAGEELGSMTAWWLDTYRKFFRASPFNAENAANPGPVDTINQPPPVEGEIRPNGYLFTVSLRNGGEVVSFVNAQTLDENGYDVRGRDKVVVRSVMTSNFEPILNEGERNFKSNSPGERLRWPTRIELGESDFHALIQLRDVRMNLPAPASTRPAPETRP